MSARARYIALRDRQVGLEFAARDVRRVADANGTPTDVATELYALADRYTAQAAALDADVYAAAVASDAEEVAA